MSDSANRAQRRSGDRAPFQNEKETVRDPGAQSSETAVDDEVQRALRRLDGLARVLDSCVRVPFTPLRFGVDGLVGLVPIVGDAATAALSLYPIAEARRLGFRTPTILRMLGNVALDAIVGAIPIVGDLFDFGFKANQRNVELLRRRLHDRGGNTGRSRHNRSSSMSP